jgi:DNA-binding beta-propeller fold protein YncE
VTISLYRGSAAANLFPILVSLCSVLILSSACSSSAKGKTAAGAVESFGSQGKSPGRLLGPRGIDVAPDGTVAVADRTGRIQFFDSAGRHAGEFMLPEMDHGTPTGILFDATDPTTTTLLIADTHHSRVLRYSLGGRSLLTFGEYGAAPGRMIYPTDLAVDPEGNIYLTEYGEVDRVMKFTRDGEFIKQWGTFGREPGQFQRALGLIYAPPDRIIVADSCNHRIQEFTTEGERIAVWGAIGGAPGQVAYPYDIALGKNGLLYVSEFGNNRIQAFARDGRPVAHFGSPGTDIGKFGTPWGIAVAPDGRIYVADTNNHRIQILRPEMMEPWGA